MYCCVCDLLVSFQCLIARGRPSLVNESSWLWSPVVKITRPLSLPPCTQSLTNNERTNDVGLFSFVGRIDTIAFFSIPIDWRVLLWLYMVHPLFIRAECWFLCNGKKSKSCLTWKGNNFGNFFFPPYQNDNSNNRVEQVIESRRDNG